jgi:signal transduction histidine kinase
MRRFFRRSIFWLLPAVIIPLGALLVMQYRFLRLLEQKTASAERNGLRGALEQVTTDVEGSMRRASGAALCLSATSLENVSTLGDHFRRHPVPGARTFFALRFSGEMSESGFFDPWGGERIVTDTELEAVKMVIASWHLAYRLNRVAQPSLYVDERDPRNRIILRPIVDASWHVIGVAGVILDEQLAKAAMIAQGSKLLKRRDPKGMIAIYFGERFPKSRGDGRDYITVPVGFVFTNWRAGIRDSCETPEQIAAMNFRSNMMWTGGSFVVLLGAVLLALGAVARQMRLSQMKSDFVSNVSHELRTPLSSIRVFGEYMRLGRVTKDEKIREYGEYIEAESRRLTQLINNILDFSRIESAEKKYRFANTDIVDLVQHTVAGFEVPLREHGVRIAFRADDARPQISVDRDAIAQVLMNLLDNAVKYSNGNREIEVSLATSGGEVRIAVHDRGIGIAQSEQKKIFEKFYRVGSGLVHDVKGSGLGLSIVMHVVKAHRGRVEIQSAPGQGSTFTIVLPVAGAAEAVTVGRTEFA